MTGTSAVQVRVWIQENMEVMKECVEGIVLIRTIGVFKFTGSTHLL
jgi:hypothetical protein